MAVSPRRGHIPDFAVVAADYATRGIACVPLCKNEDGIAKVPIGDSYYRARPSDNTHHHWATADGIGIVLGPPSGNLATIDVDDVGLSDFLARNLKTSLRPLMSGTARDQLHIYVMEPAPSRPVDLEVRYNGRKCLVQLLAAACVAAAPPTPGYRWIDASAQPLYGTASEVWRSIALDLNLPYREARPWSFMRRERSIGPTTAQIRQALR